MTTVEQLIVWKAEVDALRQRLRDGLSLVGWSPHFALAIDAMDCPAAFLRMELRSRGVITPDPAPSDPVNLPPFP